MSTDDIYPSSPDEGRGLNANSVLSLRSKIPPCAFSAGILGTEREGSAALIDDELVLTAGYLVLEAEEVWLTPAQGPSVSGHVLAADPVTGFGLVHTLGRLALEPLRIGTSAEVSVGSRLKLVAAPSLGGGKPCRLIERRPFAGYWEYLVEDAMFVGPAHPRWGGAACVDEHGLLVGMGSLMIQHGQNGPSSNMVVPIDPLPEIVDDLACTGRGPDPPRPWLGLYAQDEAAAVVVIGVVSGGPADEAGVEPGDTLASVAGVPVGDLADLWRLLWSQGEAGVTVKLGMIKGDGSAAAADVRTIDRAELLWRPRAH